VKRAFLAASLAIIVGAAAMWLVVLLRHNSSQTSSARPQAIPKSVSQAREVGSALGKLATDPEFLVASSSQQRVAGQARRAVPAGSTVTPDEKSWLPDGVGGGVMTVTITPPGHPAVRYAAVMEHEPGGWKVLATLVLPSVTPSGRPS
jgi:hypothetical protein